MYGPNIRYKVIFIGAVQYKAKTRYLCNFFEPFSKNIKKVILPIVINFVFSLTRNGSKNAAYYFLNWFQYICIILNIIPVIHYAKTYSEYFRVRVLDALLFFR